MVVKIAPVHDHLRSVNSPEPALEAVPAGEGQKEERSRSGQQQLHEQSLTTAASKIQRRWKEVRRAVERRTFDDISEDRGQWEWCLVFHADPDKPAQDQDDVRKHVVDAFRHCE